MSDVRSPTLADVIDHGVQSALGDVRVCLPGKVKAYDATRQSVHVQPILRQTYVDENDDEVSVAFPVIPNVPVVFPGGGGYRVTFPIAAGDDVLLVFSDYGLDKYLSNGGASVDPVAAHQHHLTDAIAIPGLHAFNAPWTGASTDHMTLGADGGPQVHLTGSGINLGAASAAHAVAQGDNLNTAIAQLGTAIAAALATMGAATTAPMLGSLAVTAGGAVTTAVTAFVAASAAALSPIVKVP